MAAALPPMSCTHFKALSGSGNLKGFAEIEIKTSFGPLIIRDVRLIQQPGQRAFVAPPQKEWTKSDGTKQYTELIGLPREWKDRILELVLPHYEPKEESSNPEDTGDIPF